MFPNNHMGIHMSVAAIVIYKKPKWLDYSWSLLKKSLIYFKQIKAWKKIVKSRFEFWTSNLKYFHFVSNVCLRLFR